MKTNRMLALIMALLIVTLTAAGAEPDPVARAASQYAELDGIKIHYKSLGEGREALVFIHGWTCNLNFWRFQAPAFAGETRVLLVDLPGHGQSDKPEITYTMDLFARAIEAVMRAAKVDRAVLAGHSMGTPVVRQFYRLYPQKTLALVVVDGALRSYFKDPAQAEPFIAPLRGPNYKAAAARFVDGMLPQTMPAALRDEIRGVMTSAPQHVGVGAMEGMFKDMAIWKPDPIRVPLQLLLAASPEWSADYKKFVRGLAPQVDYRTFSGVSHFLMMEQPNAVNRALQEFLVKNRLLGFK